MNPDWRRLIERIHHSARQSVVAVTGGGATAIADLLSVPGGSRTILEAVVPYAAPALSDWLGRAPEQFCHRDTALAMAAKAYQRAGRLAEQAEFPSGTQLGLACTASLVSNRPKRGTHRCHVALQRADATACWSLVLEKGARNRDEEETVVRELLLLAMAEACELHDHPPLSLHAGEEIVRQWYDAPALLIDLLHRRTGVVWRVPRSANPATGELVAELSTTGTPPPRGLLCGAFNPLHAGHLQLRDIAEHRLGGPVYFELSIHNVDKPALDYLTISERCAQLGRHPVALTDAPTFVAKSLVLPNTVFVVGFDTAVRILEPRYYQADSGGVSAVLESIRRQGCSFLVAGRAEVGRFRTLAEIPLPPEGKGLFTPLSEETFRMDVSSTQLRLASVEEDGAAE